jgi:hypothetical protein
MNFEDAVGKWCLIKENRSWVSEVTQVFINRISPAGKYIEYRLLDNTHEWKSRYDIELLDVLDG